MSRQGSSRRRVLQLGGGLASMGLAGCIGGGGGSNSTGGGFKGSLTSWSFHIHTNIMEECAVAYEEETGVAVESTNVPADKYNERLTQTLQTGQDLPSAVTMRPGPVHGLATGDAVLDISDVMSKYEDQFFNVSKNRCRIEDSVLEVNKEGYYVALGNDLGPYIILYNTELFDQAGLPTDPETVREEIQTWKQFINAGEQVMSKTSASAMIGDAFNNQNDLFNAIMSQLHGKYYTPFDGSAEFNFNQLANIKAAQVTKELTKVATNVPRFGNRHVEMIKNGDIATVIAPAWAQFAFKGTGDVAEVSGSFPDMKGQWRGFPIPRPDDILDDMSGHLPSGLKVPRAANQAGSLGGIPTGLPSAEEKHAKDWLEFWLTSETKLELLFETGVGTPFLPKGGAADIVDQPVEYFGGQPINRLWVESGRNSPDQFRTPTGTARELNYEAGSKMFVDGKDIKPTIEKAHKDMKRSIESSSQT